MARKWEKSSGKVPRKSPFVGAIFAPVNVGRDGALRSADWRRAEKQLSKTRESEYRQDSEAFRC